MVFRKADIYKPAPKSEVFFVAVLKLCELGACFVVKACVFFGFLVEFNVKLNELVYSALFYIFAASPLAVSRDELAEPWKEPNVSTSASTISGIPSLQPPSPMVWM